MSSFLIMINRIGKKISVDGNYLQGQSLDPEFKFRDATTVSLYRIIIRCAKLYINLYCRHPVPEPGGERCVQRCIIWNTDQLKLDPE